jgi:hypothetical protein
MIKKGVFLNFLFHTLALGGNFSTSCTDIEILQGTALMRANCYNFQKTKTKTDLDLHTCVPCLVGQNRIPCTCGFCEFTGVINEKRVKCSFVPQNLTYDLGEMLLCEGRDQTADRLY